jgi:hypothetical protein
MWWAAATRSQQVIQTVGVPVDANLALTGCLIKKSQRRWRPAADILKEI